MTYREWRTRLADANDPAFIPISHLDALLNSGLAQFWATERAALVTQVVEWPGGARTINAVAAAGDQDDITGSLKDAAEEWARETGCTHVLIEGRDGWRRKLTDYRHHQTVLVKELG